MALVDDEISSSYASSAIISNSCLSALLLTPITAYYVYKLWYLGFLKNMPVVRKRHPRLMMNIVTLFNIYASIIRPITDLFVVNGVDLGLFGIFLTNLSLFGIPLLTIRVWLFYFQIKHQLHTLTFKWKAQLTGNSCKIPWTSKVQWLGNTKILSLIAILIGSISLITTMYVICQYLSIHNVYFSHFNVKLID